MEMQLTAVCQKRGRWYVAYVEEIPGVNTQGRTLKEARENLKDALEQVVEANRELPIHNGDGIKSRREPISIETPTG